MANTTNFNWETPDDTDLVKDGAAAIRTLGSAIDTSLVDLKGGTTGQVLSKATNTDMDFTWVAQDDSNAIQNAIVDAKGDIVAASAADTPARLPVGTDNQRLVAASGEATGLKYVSDTQNTVIDAAGDLLYGTAADTLARLPIGTAGQVLKVNSGATAPEWGVAGGASGLTLIQRSTFSNVAGTGTTFDGVFSSTYVNYLICIENCYSATQTDDLQFVFRYSATDETSHWGNLLQNTYNASTFVSTSSAGVGQLVLNGSQSSTYPFVGQINVSNIGTSTLPAINGMGMEEDNTKLSLFYGYTTNARTYTGFRLKSASSNITGTVSVYGLAKS